MTALAALEPAAGGVYLQSYLAPLRPFLGIARATDILVQRAGEVWVEADGEMVRHEAPAITAELIERLARRIAAASHQAVSRAHPLLGSSLPTGERVQVVLPPATRGFPALAIRRQVVADLCIADLAAAGAFDGARTEPRRRATDDRLDALLNAGAIDAFLAEAVRTRRNILVAGGTGSGKTTLMNALLREVDMTERVIAIEDTPEVVLHQPNSLGLVAARSEGEARVTIDDLLQASLRLRPDRLMVGELRGAEAYSYLRAVNTGHPGSITTVHADSCDGALEQLALMVLQAASALRRDEILAYVTGVVDIIVHVERTPAGRRVSEIRHAPRGR